MIRPFCWLLLAVLGAQAAFGQDAPPPPAPLPSTPPPAAALVPQEMPPTKLDAFGRETRLEGLLWLPVEEAHNHEKMANFVTQLAREQKEVWAKAEGFLELEIVCSSQYRKENPKATVEQYDAFALSEAGASWVEACEARVANDPVSGPAFRDAAIAYMELQLVVAGTLPTEELYPGVDLHADPSPELQAQLREVARLLFGYARCLTTDVRGRVDFAKPTWIEQLASELATRAEAGVCHELLALPAESPAPGSGT